MAWTSSASSSSSRGTPTSSSRSTAISAPSTRSCTDDPTPSASMCAGSTRRARRPPRSTWWSRTVSAATTSASRRSGAPPAWRSAPRPSSSGVRPCWRDTRRMSASTSKTCPRCVSGCGPMCEGHDMTERNLDELAINTIRFLCVDAVQHAGSGHPGLPMGAAAMAYVVWTRSLRHNPSNPKWPDRDRFVLSAGHGSMLLYSLLYLSGYDVSLEQIKRFRQWGSLTPGHPESHLTPGVEATTGPLGQGIANAVGMAIAEANLAARFNRPGYELIDHFTYVIASDGDMMEGVQSEACSLAGHLRLGKLIVLYDANAVTLAGSTSVTFTEDVGARFAAYGWDVQHVDDGNDLAAVDKALRHAQQVADRPSLIVVRTILGYGAPHKQGTFQAHGSPLGADEVRAAKQNLGWPVEPAFFIPDEARALFRTALERGRVLEQEWRVRLSAYLAAFADFGRELTRRLAGELPHGWDTNLPTFSDTPGLATRKASEATLQSLAATLPELMG